MAFKNALKNLVAHFGTVWALLVYITIVTAVLAGLSLPFILPIADAFADAGVFEGVSDAFSALLGDGGWNGLWNGLYAVYGKITGVFENNSRVASLTMSFLIFIVVVAFRFFFGLYEIPLATVLEGRLSSNAQYGLGGKFFSTLFVSVRYSLAKMPLMIACDALTFGVIYGLAQLMGMNFILPFAVILVILLIRSFRSAMFACWVPGVVDGYGVVEGFTHSIEIFFKRFASVYSTYFMTWLLIISVGMFISIFTLGVGLIVALPLSMAILGYLGSTEYFIKTGKRFYVDGVVVTPPSDNAV